MQLPFFPGNIRMGGLTYTEDSDDVKSIRRECLNLQDWQSQLIRSLRSSGWTVGMLLHCLAPVPFHWVLLLHHESNFNLLDELTHKASLAAQVCGTDRRRWMALACKSLAVRGWTPTMMSHAWDIPKTNIYRYLELDLMVYGTLPP
ncbi:MAG: hypothetical protein R3C20_12675 [Planctomycetaceae bacterium]